MAYMVDMSEMSSILEMAAQEEGTPLGEDVSFEDAAITLKSMDGISAVNVINDEENYLFGINFKFKTIKALNKALNELMMDDEHAGPAHTFFEIKDNVIVRKHMMSQAMDTSELLGDDESSEMAMSMLESMEYKLNFTLKKPVKIVYSSVDARIHGKKNKEVAIVANFKELTESPDALDASIVLK